MNQTMLCKNPSIGQAQAEAESSMVPTQGTVLDALKPFAPDDGLKGTFLVLRVAGMGQGLALKSIKRKYRSWVYWRATDTDFFRLDEAIPNMAERFGGEARLLRTALLDISMIEIGNFISKRIFSEESVSSDMWAYLSKLLGLRVPLMGATQDSGNAWERLANSIKGTIAQRELSVTETDMYGAEKTVVAKETLVQPSVEQTELASGIVQKILERQRAEIGLGEED